MGKPRHKLASAIIALTGFITLGGAAPSSGALAQAAPPAQDTAPSSRSLLKICKVAGPGVGVGTQFTFTPGGVSVPAGPAPGGYCVVAGSFPTGANVTVLETGPAGYGVTNIGVAGNMIGAPDLAGKKVTVSMIPGVTEVTFTNEKRTGYIEICKAGDVRGNFTFRLPDGRTVTVPAGACSPALEVPAGALTITELPTAGTTLAACSTLQPGRQLACNTTAQTSTVIIVPGDISTMTIAYFTNRRGDQAKGTIRVHKVATAIGVPGAPPPALPANFSMTVTCSGAPPATLNVAPNATSDLTVAAPSNCTVVEAPPPNTCPRGTTATWTTAYSPPGGAITVPVNGIVTVTVTNRLECKAETGFGTITLKKVATAVGNPALPPPQLPPNFGMTMNCTGNAAGHVQVPTNGSATHTVAAPTSCTVTEDALPNLCPGNMTPNWTTSYAPTGAVAIAIGGTATLTVTNRLECKPQVIPRGVITVHKTTTAHHPGANIPVPASFTMTLKCPGQPDAPIQVPANGTASWTTAAPNNCTIVEDTSALPNTCPAPLLPQWAAPTFSPAGGAVSVVAGGTANVNVENHLECLAPPAAQQQTGTIKLQKLASVAGGILAQLTQLPASFGATITCTGGASAHVQVPKNGSTTWTGPAPNICTVVEDPPPNTCGLNSAAHWTTSYLPLGGIVSLTPNAVVTALISNRLECGPKTDGGSTPIPTPVPSPVPLHGEH